MEAGGYTVGSLSCLIVSIVKEGTGWASKDGESVFLKVQVQVQSREVGLFGCEKDPLFSQDANLCSGKDYCNTTQAREEN